MPAEVKAPRKKRFVERPDIRATLLDAAEKLVREEGYAAATARRIASEVGLKHQVVFYYFGTQDDLLLAFSGAVRARAGRFEEADGSTLFLDELATLSPAAQERLLRVIEYGEVTRIGASRPMQVDVRIVAATNEDLPALARGGRFRADLLDRLSFEVITLPPLRARGGDALLLAEHFGRRMATEVGWETWPGFSEEARRALEAHDWLGNVRELRNVVERAVYRWNEPELPVAEVVFNPFDSPWRPRAGVAIMTAPVEPPLPVAVSDLRAAVDAHERALIEQALVRCRWNQRQTAPALGLSYDQLRQAMKRHGLLEGQQSLTQTNA